MKKRGLFSTWPNLVLLWLIGNLAGVRSAAESAGRPICLLSENPCYFEWQGQPTILVASAGDPRLSAATDHLGEWEESEQNVRSHAAAPKQRQFLITRLP
jgi:hypothetical protein